LTDFKAFISFPYVLSNLALFENLQRGIIHFVLTIRFIQELRSQGKPVCFNLEALNNSKVCECYHSDNSDYLVYFDGWDDLAKKIAELDIAVLGGKN